MAYLVRRGSPASADDILLGLVAFCQRIGLVQPIGILFRGLNSFNNLLKLSSFMESSVAFDISKIGRVLHFDDPLMSELY